MTKSIYQRKSIPDYQNYEVDTEGNVFNKRTGKRLKQHAGRRGHLQVNLYKDKKGKHFSVHRLVASAFIPNCYDYPQVNHRDNNPANNHISNLKWGTNQMNVDDKVHAGRQVKGEQTRCARLTESDVRTIRSIPYHYGMYRQLAIEYGLGPDQTNNIRKAYLGITWKHI